jgi:integrase/recombinase XerD
LSSAVNEDRVDQSGVCLTIGNPNGTSISSHRLRHSPRISHPRNDRHAERNRLALVVSVYAGPRVGEIAALTSGDAATQNGDVRREIRLGRIRRKDRRVEQSFYQREFVRNSMGTSKLAPSAMRARHSFLPNAMVAPSRTSLFLCYSRKSTRRQGFERALIQGVAHSLRASMKRIQQLMGHRNIGTTALYCEVSDTMRNAVELV